MSFPHNGGGARAGASLCEEDDEARDVVSVARAFVGLPPLAGPCSPRSGREIARTDTRRVQGRERHREGGEQ